MRKRLLGLVVALTLVPAGTAAATGGARDNLRVVDNPLFAAIDGPGFVVGISQLGVWTHIDEQRFGIEEAGFPIVREESVMPTGVRPFQCENGTYRVVSATFKTTERASVTAPRPLPYPPAFANQFPDIFTFVGILDGAIVANEAGEQFRLYMSDLAHEELTPKAFTSTNPIHAYIVDQRGRVRDRASLVGRVSVNRATGEAKHNIVDEGTCHQSATVLGQPGVTVFGPFFVLPFPTTVVRR